MCNPHFPPSTSGSSNIILLPGCFSYRQPMVFRLNAKNIFLTYPQCDISPEDAAETLSGLYTPPAACAVCREEHKDGNYHLHALVLIGHRHDHRDVRFWDLGSAHPNAQSARNPKDVLNYISKKGQPYKTSNWDLGETESLVEAAQHSTSSESFLTRATQSDRGIKSFLALRAYAEWRWDRMVTDFKPSYQWSDHPPELSDWISGNFHVSSDNSLYDPFYK